MLNFALTERAGLPLLSPEASPKALRGILRRAVFSEVQRRALEKTFERQKYISKADRNKLAADLGLKESQVWLLHHQAPPPRAHFLSLINHSAIWVQELHCWYTQLIHTYHSQSPVTMYFVKMMHYVIKQKNVFTWCIVTQYIVTDLQTV